MEETSNCVQIISFTVFTKTTKNKEGETAVKSANSKTSKM